MIKLVKISAGKATYRIGRNTILTVPITAEAGRILDYFNKLPANEK